MMGTFFSRGMSWHRMHNICLTSWFNFSMDPSVKTPRGTPTSNTSLRGRWADGRWQSSVYQSCCSQIKCLPSSLLVDLDILKVWTADGLEELPHADDESFWDSKNISRYCWVLEDWWQHYLCLSCHHAAVRGKSSALQFCLRAVSDIFSWWSLLPSRLLLEFLLSWQLGGDEKCTAGHLECMARFSTTFLLRKVIAPRGCLVERGRGVDVISLTTDAMFFTSELLLLQQVQSKDWCSMMAARDSNMTLKRFSKVLIIKRKLSTPNVFHWALDNNIA